MEHMSLKEITTAVGGTYYGDDTLLVKEATGVVIDSRQVEKDFLFVAIKGARVDGHDFIPAVLEAGALACLSEKPVKDASGPVIVVKNCEQALKDLAEHYRKSIAVKVVGITGSVGKTSTKEMIASVLSQKYNVLKTEGNFNNEIGLPLTIFKIRKEHDVAVLEMGISDFEEMHRLAKMARPNICVITNIGLCHLENLGTQEGILKAKTEMFDYRAPGAKIILNGDDRLLRTIHQVEEEKPVFFGKDIRMALFATEVRNLGLKGTTCRIHLPDNKSLTAQISIPGEHMVSNALAGAAVGYELGLSPEEIAAGIKALVPVSGRNNLIETKNFLVIDDCYNANPVSMKASLDVLSTANGRTVAILGDMFELGSEEVNLHYQVGEHAGEIGIQVICCIGKLSAATFEGARNNSQKAMVFYFETKQEFLDKMPTLLEKGDSILVKASHGMEFPEIVEKLREMEF